MNVLVIGAGGVGIELATSVASQGAEISIFARGKTAKAIKENGIERTGLFKHHQIRDVPVYESYEEIPKNHFDYIFIASKTTANENISENLGNNRDILKDNGKIIIFQNGFGNDEIYLKYFTKEQVFCGRVITGASRPERHISEITIATDILLGSLQGENPECLREIAELIDKSDISCEISEEIDKYLWAKMLYNCALNPLGAILDVNYGRLTENPYTVRITQDTTLSAVFAELPPTPPTPQEPDPVILPVPTYHLVIGSNNCNQVSENDYPQGSTFTFTAKPQTGWIFRQWSDGNTDNPRTLTLTQDSVLTAVFDLLPTTEHHVIIRANDCGEQWEGDCLHRTEITLNAESESGYKFSHWSDGNTDNPRQVTVTEDATFTAVFESQAPTGLEDENGDVRAPSAIKYIDNGILYIERNGITYTAQGQRID